MDTAGSAIGEGEATVNQVAMVMEVASATRAAAVSEMKREHEMEGVADVQVVVVREKDASSWTSYASA